jgi:hypothetical protein
MFSTIDGWEALRDVLFCFMVLWCIFTIGLGLFKALVKNRLTDKENGVLEIAHTGCLSLLIVLSVAVALLTSLCTYMKSHEVQQGSQQDTTIPFEQEMEGRSYGNDGRYTITDIKSYRTIVYMPNGSDMAK